MILRVLTALALAIGLSGCFGRPDAPPAYTGPEVTSIVVYKERHKLYLMHDDQVMKSYDIALGFNPVGHKQFEGDGKTPEGTYFIDWLHPNSQYHRALRVSYPNAQDRAYAASQGRSPGGDIFVHGGPKGRADPDTDWTAGCIAVRDEEIEEIYSMVRPGTPIFIYP